MPTREELDAQHKARVAKYPYSMKGINRLHEDCISLLRVGLDCDRDYEILNRTIAAYDSMSDLLADLQAMKLLDYLDDPEMKLAVEKVLRWGRDSHFYFREDRFGKWLRKGGDELWKG